MKNKCIMKRLGALLLCISIVCATYFHETNVNAYDSLNAQYATDKEQFTKLTLSNLGIDEGYYYAGASGAYEQGFADTMVSFYATSVGQYFPRIHLGSWGETDRTGISVVLYGAYLTVGNDGFSGDENKKLNCTTATVWASEFGLTSFLDQKILYQLQTEYLVMDADGVKNDIRFTLYINRIEAVKVDIKDQTDKLGNYIYIVDGVHTLQNYVEEILDESSYTCYTLSDAGIADGRGDIFGRLLDSNGLDIAGSAYDKVLFGAKVTWNGLYPRIHYATNAGDVFNGIQIRLEPDGSLILEDYSSVAGGREVLSYQTMVIEPKQFGYESFENQSFKLQLTTDLVACDSAAKDDVRLGIWINGKLANNTYCFILNQLEKLGSSINFFQAADSLHYSLWDIEAPTGEMENYVELTEKASYLVEADVLVNEHSKVSYGIGDKVTVAGDYKASYEVNGDFAATEKRVILWKSYDTHADSEYDVRDLVAMKKAASGMELETRAGQKAASELDCASACKIMREYLSGKREHINADSVPALYYQTDEDGKVMPISGWFSPGAWLGFKVDVQGNIIDNYKQYGVETNYLQDKYYKMIQDLGINVLAYQEKNYAECNEMQILKGLSLAEEYEMNFYVLDSGISDAEDESSVLANRINAYSRFSSFAGVLVTDEPKTDYFNSDWEGVKYIHEIGNKATLLNSYANLIGYVNLSTGGNTEVYKRYVEEYIDTCHPKYLSFDHYPFMDGGSVSFYLGSMKVIREQALKNEIPFGGCVGTSTTSYSMIPNKDKNAITAGQINWKVNTLLAYGAKGYTWFTLIQPRLFALEGDENGITGMDFERAGLIGADGSETPVYPHAKKINDWVGRIDSILMDSESLAVVADGAAQSNTGYTENCYGNMTIHSAHNNSNGAIAGVFHYKGQMAYYVVNMDYESEQTVTLSFDTACDLAIYEPTLDSVKEVSDISKQQLTLKAGAAALVVVK